MFVFYIKTCEESIKDKSIREITRMICDLYDIAYFSGRKFGFGRGGGIPVRDEEKRKTAIKKRKCIFLIDNINEM